MRTKERHVLGSSQVVPYGCWVHWVQVARGSIHHMKVWHGSTAPLWPGICSATGGTAACADVWGMFHDRWTTDQSRYSSRIQIFHHSQVFLLTTYYQPQSLSLIIDMGCKKCHIYENNSYYLPIFSCFLHTYPRRLWFTVTAENWKLHEDPVSETTQVEDKKSHLQLVMINNMT